MTAAKLNCLSSCPSVRPPLLRSSFSGNAQERKLDYGNEAEKKFAGGAERKKSGGGKRIMGALLGLCKARGDFGSRLTTSGLLLGHIFLTRCVAS